MRILLSGCLFSSFAVTGCLAPGDTPEETDSSVSALSSVGGAISATEILDRAKYWYQLCNDADKTDCTVNQMWYTTEMSGDSDYHTDSQSRSYRKDCSGYVSMALHLNDSFVTSTLPNVLTQIAIDDLQPGDVIDSPVGGHTFLFEKWGDSTHSYYYAYSFGTTPIHHRTVYRNGSELDTSDIRTYYAYHYPKNTQGTISSKFAPALMYDVQDGTMRIYPWTSNGSSFAGPGTDYYQSGSFNLDNVGDRVASGDVDGDGTNDIVTAYQRSDGTFQFNVFKNGDTSAGIWYVSGSFSLSRVGGRLVVDDFNGDGKAEPALVYDNGDGTMTIYRWLSTGSSFTRTTDYQSGSFHLAQVGDRVASGDVNGDGKADVVMAYQLSDGTFAFYVFLDGITSVGRWYTSGPFSLSAVQGRMVLADFTGDGKAEPALAYDVGDGTMTIYRWVSSGTSFTRTTDYQSSSFHLTSVGNRVASGDVDGDGKADIVMAYQKNDGTFQFNVFDQGATSAGVWYNSGSYNLANVGGRIVMGNW